MAGVEECSGQTSRINRTERRKEGLGCNLKCRQGPDCNLEPSFPTAERAGLLRDVSDARSGSKSTQEELGTFCYPKRINENKTQLIPHQEY